MTRTVITGATIIDGTGADPFRADVAIEGTTIVAVGRDLAVDGADIRDATGCTLLPGFIDAHVHVCLSDLDLVNNLGTPFSYQFYAAGKNLRKTLDIGITTIRDASGADLGMQQALEDGLIDGPAMHISIVALSQTGGHGDHWLPSGNVPEILGEHPGRPAGIVDGVDDARRSVRTLIRHGANVIKVNTSGGVFSPRDDPRRAHFSQAELEVMVEECERAGVYAMAHAHSAEGVKNALRAGFRSIEHGTELDEEAITLFLERRAWLVPTLGVGTFILDRIERGASVLPSVAAKAEQNVRMRAESFRAAVDAGVRIAMGSDSAAQMHGSNLVELRLMAEGGMAPLDVIESATRSAAQLLRIDDRVGTVSEGMQADLVLIHGDPFDWRAYPANILEVYREGRLRRSFPTATSPGAR